MTEININVNIRAKWINGMPCYRLWVDDELICERTFWPNPAKHFIRENFTVEIEPGKHKLVLEQINMEDGTALMYSVGITNTENNIESSHKIAVDEFDKMQTLTFSA